MPWDLLAVLCCGLFAGAAIYVTLVEHPARMACGTVVALAEFAPSYRRGAVMQASLAAIGCLAAVVAWWQGAGTSWLIGGLLLGFSIPWTLLVILPTNKRLLDPALDGTSPEATMLLKRWGSLHLVRSITATLAFIVLLVRPPIAL